MFFKQYFVDVVKESYHKIIIDLSQVRFMDSSGLGALVYCLKKMPIYGEIVIVGAQSDVRRLFTLTRMDRLFTHYQELNEVIAEVA